MHPPRLLLAGFVLFAAACSARHIPGTQIEDNDDTRAILNVMEKYRAAVEARDADGVLSLLSESFLEDFGTASPEDDLDYKSVRQKLPESMAKFEDVRL